MELRGLGVVRMEMIGITDTFDSVPRLITVQGPQKVNIAAPRCLPRILAAAAAVAARRPRNISSKKKSKSGTLPVRCLKKDHLADNNQEKEEETASLLTATSNEVGGASGDEAAIS
jgi:hypothetical protein